MASIGAFLAGDKFIIDFLKYNMRSQMFAKSLPLPIIIGNLKRLELLRTQPELRKKLWHNVHRLQDGLRSKGFEIGNTDSCVTPVYMKGSVNEATQLVHDLRENYRIFCSIVVYPVVPKDVILLRLIPTASHTDEDIDITLDAFSSVAGKLKRGEYNKDFAEV